MDQLKLANESLRLVQKDLGLEEEINLSEAEDPFADLHQFLTRQIQYLLDNDFGYLLNAMYRIDIGENKLKEILELSEPGKIAFNLSKSVIEREKSKVITRIRYSS